MKRRAIFWSCLQTSALVGVICLGCVGREVTDADGTSGGSVTSTASTSGVAATSSASTGVGPATATTAVGSSTSTSAGESTAGSSTTGFDDGCPQGVDEVGAVGIVVVEGWDFLADELETGTCDAYEFVEGSLWLRCRQDGGPPVDVEVEIGTWGDPVVKDALAAMVGLEDLQLVMDSGWNGLTARSAVHLSLRTSTGELLVLYSKPRYPSTPPDPVGLDLPGWTDPFQSIHVIDAGCELIPSDGSAGPYTRYALEVTGDDGDPVTLFERQQEAVIAGGHPYEISLVEAAHYVDPCVDCPEFRFHFSVVRHP